jgi:hypothetical protein
LEASGFLNQFNRRLYQCFLPDNGFTLETETLLSKKAGRTVRLEKLKSTR